jgi:adenylosuccinate synthase
MVNGVSELCMMKGDVLSIFDEIKACTKYIIEGQEVTHFPFDINDHDIQPVYESIPGWRKDLTKLEGMNEAPDAFKSYVDYLEKQLNVPIHVVSVGPDRKQTLDNTK